MEVVSEANSFAQGWGQVIFPTASEMLANEKIRAIYERTAETRAELGMKSHMLLQLLLIDKHIQKQNMTLDLKSLRIHQASPQMVYCLPHIQDRKVFYRVMGRGLGLALQNL